MRALPCNAHTTHIYAPLMNKQKALRYSNRTVKSSHFFLLIITVAVFVWL